MMQPDAANSREFAQKKTHEKCKFFSIIGSLFRDEEKSIFEYVPL